MQQQRDALAGWTPIYVGKILHVRAGEALSLQYRRVKDRHDHGRFLALLDS